jgi:hypothetical protein
MLPSFHDDYLVSYAVDCSARKITLCIQNAFGQEPTRTVVFTGVEGYRLENDAFGNIIFALEEVPVGGLLAKIGPEVAESHRVAGAMGAWAADLASAAEKLGSNGIRGFVLTSTLGLSGWVLATTVTVTSDR